MKKLLGLTLVLALIFSSCALAEIEKITQEPITLTYWIPLTMAKMLVGKKLCILHSLIFRR